MPTQYEVDIPFCASHEQQPLKLIELPNEVLAILESSDPPPLSIISSPATSTTPSYALLRSGSKTYQMRQKNTSNIIMILQPTSTNPMEHDDPATFIEQPAISTIAKIADTIELIEQELDSTAKAPPKVNKWHEKFAKSRSGKTS